MLLVLLACASAPIGLYATPAGDGPTVVFDWDAKPLANLPFPNDLATRPDPGSPTGLRVNLPLEAQTEHEGETRAKIDQLTGFGIYAPISAAFDRPLDLDVIAAAHSQDTRLGPERLDDDVIYLINVDPDSPDYGTLAALDLGEGRFPMDVPNPNRYFENDPRSTVPSLVFDTTEEDLNGNGLLDPGEDTDNDGVLDIPNVYPEGGDARDDLLTWYERTTNTLIARPVVPLDEETTYAVVLTTRLVGLDGSPARSPWDYVHHLKQTEALRPLDEILPDLGLGWSDVAFAWTYTTARVTGDLVDIYRGLHGEGPFSAMATDYPAGVTEAAALHELPEYPAQRLPINEIAQTLQDLGLIEGEGGDMVVATYEAAADAIVGGAFTTPYLLADRDDDGTWDVDEWWDVDAMTGTVAAEPQRLVFSCILPKATADNPPPFDVAIFGHGYGSSRFEFLNFGWAMNHLGLAACAVDFPGHGLVIPEEYEDLADTYLRAKGLYPFLDHLIDARQRDLNNDGVADGGGDQWTADAFHTRDMVRQAAVDWMQLIRSFQACGTGTMTLPDGTSAASCDWDGDGAADLGGPDATYTIAGGSLGGINAGVAAAVLPDVAAWAPVVPGAGLVDVASRTEIGGAVEAMVGRLMSPIFVGRPQSDGSVQVVQLVNSVADMAALPVGTLASVPAGGKIVVENLNNGVIREASMPSDGSFRLHVPADGLDPYEKRALTGMPADGPAFGATYSVPDNEGLGDPLVISVYDANGALVQTLDTFDSDVLFEGVTYPAGSPLVAGSYGSGNIRGTPEFRRITSAFSMLIEPGDPAAYGAHYALQPFDALGGAPTRVLIMPTPGDTWVNTNTGIALARIAGALDTTEVDSRYGLSEDQYLIDRRVVQGLEEFGPYTDVNGAPCLYDVDDFDVGTDGTGAPSDTPLRASNEPNGGLVALRLPYVESTGRHGFGLPEPSAAFDINTFAVYQIASFLATGGQELSDDACLATRTCDWIPAIPEE